MVTSVIDMKLTGEKIAALREKNGLSVNQLKDRLGLVNVQAIYKWQRGETLPAIDNLVALARVLSVPIEEILVVEYRDEGRG